MGEILISKPCKQHITPAHAIIKGTVPRPHPRSRKQAGVVDWVPSQMG